MPSPITLDMTKIEVVIPIQLCRSTILCRGPSRPHPLRGPKYGMTLIRYDLNEAEAESSETVGLF